MFLKVLSILLLIPGFACAIFSKVIVRKFNLDEKVECNFEHEMSEEELLQYKFSKAEVNVKLGGMLLALPGIIMVLIVFK
ncbi:hypothetical protein RBH29_11835 [Herbivorax sp. ANBcel31]|uniref:hypothetical protein n=1 Tax=Herbivorax sp. ANBcel31 TaxID=3069754 RepID=UPI0027AE6E82|nr:hypothetical protein [Herbivorax sp. ANBcel31]MDQ2087116.1 hypothetical protein [Herbivorax sp. ANBcel31]